MKKISTFKEDKLKENRERIDKIDEEIFCLLEKRLKCVQEIGKIKNQTYKKVVDLGRENKIISKRKKDTILSGSFVEDLYRVIFKESRNQQK